MPGGHAAERERFVRDFLRHQGARLTAIGAESASRPGPPRGPLAAELPPALARRLGAARLDIVFRPAELAAHPGAALMAPGNPVFERLVALARRGGSVSRRYLVQDPGGDARRWLPAAGPLAAAAPRSPAYRSRILFTFRVAYRAFDGFDDIRSIVVTPATGRAEDGRDFFRDRNLSEEPQPGVDPAPAIDIGAALRIALAELERRIGAQVARFAQRAGAELEREAEQLREFYVGLIAEEKSRRPRRRETPAIAATGRKVEWVQRVDREMRLYAPRITVNLLGLEEIWVPVSPLTAGRGGPALAAELDLVTGEIFRAACQVCAVELALGPGGGGERLPSCHGGHLVCERCLRACRRCQETFCQLCAAVLRVAEASDACYAPPFCDLDLELESACPSCTVAGGHR